ncbi:MAG TPA: hypothetical protein EYH31_00020 [Anaerolineae bacterium]|nr:hypothetical protein [Anaerolineae bacterium]
MSKSKKPRSRRELRALERQRQQRQQRMMLIGVVLVAVALVAILIWAGNRPKSVAVATHDVPPNADGLAWGPADAPVLIQEYADFQ